MPETQQVIIDVNGAWRQVKSGNSNGVFEWIPTAW